MNIAREKLASVQMKYPFGATKTLKWVAQSAPTIDPTDGELLTPITAHSS
jgi:hypothetical protein